MFAMVGAATLEATLDVERVATAGLHCPLVNLSVEMTYVHRYSSNVLEWPVGCKASCSWQSQVNASHSLHGNQRTGLDCTDLVGAVICLVH